MTTWDLTSPPGETARLRARVAHLQRELGEARAEGITRTRLPLAGADGHDVYHVDPWPTEDCADSVLGMFRRLWDSLYRARALGWDVDPWVWCVRFDRVEVDCA